MWWSRKKTPQEEIDAITTDHLDEALRPKPPNLSESGALHEKLQAHNQLAGKQSKPLQKYSGVDYEGLEKAAAAAKLLDASPNSQNAIKMAQESEETKRIQSQERIEQYKLQIAQAEGEQIKIREQERRETQRLNLELSKERSKFEDQLARQRDKDKLADERQTQEHILQAQEESIKKQEALRKETMKHEMQLRRENDEVRIHNEAKAKAQYDRENHDIKMEQIKTEQEEIRKGTVLKTQAWIRAGAQFLEANFGNLPAIGYSLTILGGCAFAYFIPKYVGQTGMRYAQARFMRPKLVRETNRSRFLSLQTVAKLNPTQFLKSYQAISSKSLANVFVNPSVHMQIQDIAIGAQQTMKNDGPLRNVLLYGPPGTGKSLFARQLAQHSKMTYAIIAGGDVIPLGGAAVTEIHNLFSWAEKESNGMILFIDEADAFLRKRNDDHGKMSENMRAAINSFLMKTGTESKKVMLVMATNQPEQLDSAIIDRLDTKVLFPLPGTEEREKMLTHFYSDRLVGRATAPKTMWKTMVKGARTLRIDVEDDDITKTIKRFADKTEGFSGRQLSKLVTAWEHSLYSNKDGVLSMDLMEKDYDNAKRDNEQGVKWLDDKEVNDRYNM